MSRLRRLIPGFLVLTALLAGACADTYGVAARFGDVEVSHEDLEHEVTEWQDSPDFLAQVGLGFADGDSGGTDSTFVAAILGIKIRAEAARVALVDAGAEVPGDDAVDDIVGQIEPFRGVLSDRTVEGFARDFLAITQAGNVVGTFPPLDDVYVSPRYGTYGPDGQLVPPQGPATPPADFSLQL